MATFTTESSCLPRDLIFALPDGSERISGGNLYNLSLLQALSSRVSLRCESIETCRANVEHGLPGFYFIDSLNLDDFADFPSQKPGQYFGLLVHHLPSLEPGLDWQSPAMARERAVLPRFDALLATSPFTVEHLCALGIAPNRVLTVLPAPPKDAGPPRSYEPPLTAILVGNLIPRKGVLELLELLIVRLRETDRLALEILGRADIDAAYSERCLYTIQSSIKSRDRVHYRGEIPTEEMREWYGRASVLISASRMETFGMALQEAQSFGVPILALAGGYTRTHVAEGENGHIFGSLEALVDELCTLARDAERARRLFRRAQERRPNTEYTWQNAAELFLAQLTELRRS